MRTPLLSLALLAATSGTWAQSTGPIRIGFVTDMSSLYADGDGPAGADAIRWAVQDFGGKVLGRPVEVLAADHLNKPDIASTKVREWIDKEQLAGIIAGTNSGVTLSLAKLATEKRKPLFAVGAGSARITNEDCTPYTVHYAYDTVALAKVAASALVQQGVKDWYFLTADYAFGHSLEADASHIVKAAGGKVSGSVRHPLNASDFSSFLLQAQASKAQVLALANAGGDFTNAMKAAREFGITSTMKVTGLLVFINDIHALGLRTTAGLQVTDSWYWNQDEDSRKFARRFFEKYKRMPSSLQAADYSAALTYLKAVQAAGTTEADAVMTQVKKMRIDDFYHRGATVRPDGRLVHEMALYQVKAPGESTTPWDYYKLVAKVPGEQAFASLNDSRCPLMRK